jgi:hypothetical protein
MARRYFPKNVEELVHWYERYVSPVSLVAGFLADNFILLRRVDLLRSNLLLFSYLLIAALGIFLINLIESGRVRTPWLLKVAPLLSVVVQFSFGGLFSGYLSLYSRSAALPATWVFVVALAALLIGNERFVRLYTRFTFQLTLYFTVLFSFLIFFLPVVFHQIGPYMFVTAGFVALALVAVFVRFIRFFMPELVKRERTRLARSIAVVFLVFNTLYFVGAIPPLPLALKDAGVYHAVTRQADGSYTLEGEQTPWWDVVFPYNPTFHRTAGETIYVWSAIFAPSGLSTSILHQWQHYDEASKQWVTVSTYGFPINGGRDGGYRGYSNKSDVEDGAWRVNVTTQYGELIGRISFTVVTVATTTQLIEVTK